jgi:hypothetical protein
LLAKLVSKFAWAEQERFCLPIPFRLQKGHNLDYEKSTTSSSFSRGYQELCQVHFFKTMFVNKTANENRWILLLTLRFHLNFHYFKSLSLNFVKCSSSYVIKSTIHCNNEWYICKLRTNYVLKCSFPKGVSVDEYFETCNFSSKNTNHVSRCELIDTENISLSSQNMKFVVEQADIFQYRSYSHSDVMNGIFANYVQTMFWSVVFLKEWVWMNILKHVIFPAKIQISKPIDVLYIHKFSIK